ncbi:MFS transporter, DHA1 family, bicyclomycin/chloramphenicol resistance protein [Xaviernesmea oryzae]|uniref:Bcr/CflA family efflux transporter n=2 Tax=Xaviernesmea oryzae TaxID=464029 RepID=A0A1X7GEJ8_9HYPH|nr:multidrug effflux MFS transporter [Xaviernesmea oryzae]SMF68538.1 MFS transporter, DHA1 family, bicyclomycin/chloramphenicol resistance protein [Xaviernesmea oryzae]
MGRAEFIAMMAMLMALNALAIDIMLPGLQEIGASLGIENENHRQYVVSSYVFGLGIAQLLYGPLSDRFGRRKPMLFGIGIYIICSIGIVVVPSFGALLALRFIQGAGAAATRVITVSIVRDVYGGRAMAEVMSLIMMVFMIVPIIAPGTGQLIMFAGNWHLIFLFIAIVSLAIGFWTYARLPETLDPADVRPFTVSSILDAFRIVLTNRIALCYTIASTFIFGALFGFINSAQQIYVGIYELGIWFPVAFAAVAVFMSTASFLNARFVGRFGMRRLSHGSLMGFILVTFLWLLVQVFGPQPMPVLLFLAFFSLAMFQFGWIGANFNSLAMEPLGHVAGTASSVLGFMSTVGGSIIGVVIGQAFNGTALPLVAGFFAVSIIGLIFVLIGEKGELFQPHNPRI